MSEVKEKNQNSFEN